MKLKSLLESANATQWFAATMVKLYNQVTGQSLPETEAGYEQMGKLNALRRTLAQEGNFQKMIQVVYSTPEFKGDVVDQAITDWAKQNK